MPALGLPPLSRFDHPKAHERPTHRPDETHSGLDLMPARHMAGVRDRPSAEETSAILRKPDLDSTEQTMTYNLFACITPDDLFRLLLGEGLTLFEIVRALHNSGVKKYSLRRRLEQFAVRPPVRLRLDHAPAEATALPASPISNQSAGRVWRSAEVCYK